MTSAAMPRVIVTLLWVLSLALFFQRWDFTFRFPGLLIWTCAFLLLFLITALLVYGRAIRHQRRAVWVPTGLWGTLVLLALVASAAVPAIAVHGVLVRSVTFVKLLDVVFPIWIFARGISMLWDPLVRTLILASVLPVLFLCAWAFMIHMPGTAYASPLIPLSTDEAGTRQLLETHVRVLAAEIGERNALTAAALEGAARYIERAFRDIGYDVAAQPFTLGPQTFRNLQVTLPGQSRPDEIVVVGAHYDAVEGSPGANDNASGTAAVLALARMLAHERFARTIRFVAFANEEPPYFDTDSMGSWIYAEHAARRGDKIVAMISLETIGYYSTSPGSQRYPFPFGLFYPDRGDFIGFVGNLASRQLVRRSIGAFRRHARFPSQGVAAPAWIPGISWSDQASFWRHGYEAIMISDTAPFRYPHYHTSEDTTDKLDYARMARVVTGVAQVVRELAEPYGVTAARSPR